MSVSELIINWAGAHFTNSQAYMWKKVEEYTQFGLHLSTWYLGLHPLWMLTIAVFYILLAWHFINEAISDRRRGPRSAFRTLRGILWAIVGPVVAVPAVMFSIAFCGIMLYYTIWITIWICVWIAVIYILLFWDSWRIALHL